MKKVIITNHGKQKERLILTDQSEELTLIQASKYFGTCFDYVIEGLGRPYTKGSARRFFNELTSEIKNKKSPRRGLTKGEWN